MEEYLLEVAEFMDNNKYVISPKSSKRQQALGYIKVLNNYNNGFNTTKPCPDNKWKSESHDPLEITDQEIVTAVTEYVPSIFDNLYEEDEDTGLPTSKLNIAGGILVSGLVVSVVAVICIVFFIKLKIIKTEEQSRLLV